MAFKERNTEHAGAKHAKGYRGHKVDAKHESSRRRRVADKQACRGGR